MDRTARKTDSPALESPALIINPRSGGGKALEHDLVGQCRARGIEPVVMKPADDLPTLADRALTRGADAIGMAGGDGSLAAVAALAVQHDVPFVCVPAGTRNHFALDVGLDRTDVTGALDAFTSGFERRIDLARVNGRLFLNNASMGFYGRLVQSPEYRAAKIRTALRLLPKLMGPGTEPFQLRFTGPDGYRYGGAHLVLVSNNPYAPKPRADRGAREGIDGGLLGVVVAAPEPPPHGLREWAAFRFSVDSGEPVEVGIDGEALTMEPPLDFESVPRSLRVRLPHRGARVVRRSPRLDPR